MTLPLDLDLRGRVLLGDSNLPLEATCVASVIGCRRLWGSYNFYVITAMLLSASLFFIPSPGTTPDLSDASGQLCLPLPPIPSDVEVSHFDGESADGSSYWGASATYELSTGDVGEAHIVVDSDGFGEAHFAINGEIVSYASISRSADSRSADAHGTAVNSWSATELNYPAEVIAELMQAEVASTMLSGMVPQEFKCSSFGRRAIKMAKYVWVGLSGAAGAACCMATQVGCPLCVGAAGAVGAAGVDAANEYCD